MVALSSLGGAGWQFFDANGVPLAGGKLFTYKAGTTTPAVTYTDILGNTSNPNPIILDSAGRVSGQIWLTNSEFYKFVLQTSTGTLIWTKDNVPGIVGAPGLNADGVAYLPPYPDAVTSNYTVQDRLGQVISVEDFGAVGDGLTDDTAAIQAAINYAQTLKAWIYFPPKKFAYMVTGLTIGQTGTNYTCHFMGGGFDTSMAAQSGIIGQFEAQSMIKLIDNSNTSLITVNEDAAPPQFFNITLNGNSPFQTGTSYCLYLPDAAAAPYYRFAAWMQNCLVTTGRSGGIFIGSNRGAGYYENVWVQYCGTTTSDAAINVRCFDQQFRSVQIGPNPGTGMFLGQITQIQMTDCVMFMNHVGLQVSEDCGHLQVVDCAFDDNSTYGSLISGYGPLNAEGARTFTGCHWRRNSASADNTYSDILVDSDRLLILNGPIFGGNEAGPNRVRYNIEFFATRQTPLVRVSDAVHEKVNNTNTAVLGFTNNDAYLMLAGTIDSFIGKFGGGGSMSAICNAFEKMRWDVNGTKCLDALYLPKDDGTIQTASAQYAGAGAPSNANGNNGDFYFRSDGTAGSRIYFKTGGVWTAIL